MTDRKDVVGWSNTVVEPAFGAGSSGGDASVKSKLVNLMTSIRTLMRSMYLRNFYRGLLGSDDIADEFTVPLIAINTIIILYEFALG